MLFQWNAYPSIACCSRPPPSLTTAQATQYRIDPHLNPLNDILGILCPIALAWIGYIYLI